MFCASVCLFCAIRPLCAWIPRLFIAQWFACTAAVWPPTCHGTIVCLVPAAALRPVDRALMVSWSVGMDVAYYCIFVWARVSLLCLCVCLCVVTLCPWIYIYIYIGNQLSKSLFWSGLVLSCGLVVRNWEKLLEGSVWIGKRGDCHVVQYTQTIFGV